MLRQKSISSELIPVTLLILSVLIFFSKIILSGNPLFGSDFILQFYPWKKFIHDSVWARGSLPFWNPYLFSGSPFISNIQASMFYPFGLLFYILPTEYAYGYTVIIHCILGSVFMYLFVRSLSVSRAGAFLAAIIFTYNGFFMAHLYAGHLTFVQNYIWIPLIFFYLNKFLNGFSFRYAVLTGLILGIQILGGFPQIAFYTILAILAFGLFYIVVSLSTRVWKEVLNIGLGLVVILCLGFALAAIQVFPTLEFTGLSTRAGGVGFDFATYDSLHPKELLSFLIPDIFGNVVDQTYWRSPEIWHFWETCGYVGILPLCLVFVSTRSAFLRRLRLFFGTLLLVALFLALGKYNPLYPLIYKLPGFNSFRIPAQILFLYIFGVAVAAGIGMDRISREQWLSSKLFVVFLAVIGLIVVSVLVGFHADPYRFSFHLFKTFGESPAPQINAANLYHSMSFALNRAGLFFFVSILVLLMIKHKRFGPTLPKILALIAVTADLWLFSVPFVKTHEFDARGDKEYIAAQLSSNPVQGRVATTSGSFGPNDGLRYRFPSILGYDPLILGRYVRYVQASQGVVPNDHVVNLDWLKDTDTKAFRMLNLRQVVQGQSVTNVNHEFPYAAMVDKAVIKPPDEVLPYMMREGFDPHEMLVLEPEYESFMIHNDPGGDFEASCFVAHYDNETIRIRTSANQPAYLVLSEIFYPGWEARIDGKKAPILCGNYIFRVIPVEHGKHDVELRFVSWPFRAGLIISLLTLAGSIWLVTSKRSAFS